MILFFWLVGGGTPAYEAMLEKKRAALRQALRHEYIKTLYNPDLVILCSIASYNPYSVKA